MVVSTIAVHWLGTKQSSFSFSISMYEESYFQPTHFSLFFSRIPKYIAIFILLKNDGRNKEYHFFRTGQKTLFKFSIQLIGSELKIALIFSIEKSSSNFLRALLECTLLHYTPTTKIAQWDHFPHSSSVSIHLKCSISRHCWNIFVQQGIQTHTFIYH